MQRLNIISFEHRTLSAGIYFTNRPKVTEELACVGGKSIFCTAEAFLDISSQPLNFIEFYFNFQAF